MIKSFIAVITVLFFATSSLSAVNIESSPRGCWAAADQAEIQTCGYVGCDFVLWDAVYYACMAHED